MDAGWTAADNALSYKNGALAVLRLLFLAPFPPCFGPSRLDTTISTFLLQMGDINSDDRTFFLEAKIEKKMRYFKGVNLLIEHFQEPDQGFPTGHLQYAAQSPRSVPLPESAYSDAPPPVPSKPASARVSTGSSFSQGGLSDKHACIEDL